MQKLFATILISSFCCCSLFAQQPEIQKPDNLSPSSKLFLLSEKLDLFYPTANGKVEALLQCKKNTPLPVDIEVHSQIGNIYTVLLSKREVSLLSSMEGVEYIDVACRLNAARMCNDTTRILSRIDMVEQGKSNGLSDDFDGKGVVVGIVDAGFQPENPTFYRDGDTSYKVLRYWHQNEKAGTPPAGYSYGSEFTTPATISTARDDDGTHGTHVAGIAAGTGLTTPNLKYRGMAPGADLMFVTIKYNNDTLGGSALGDYVAANPNILDGYKYIFDEATKLQKPAVINLSWGMHTGPHDGTSLFDLALENLTGPGKIIVGAAGNEAANLIHVRASLNQDTAYTFAIDRSRNNYAHESVYCDFWGGKNQVFGLNAAIFDTLGNFKFETPFYYSNQPGTFNKLYTSGPDSLWFTVLPNAKYINNDKPEILIWVESNFAKNQRIRIGITGNGTIDGWNSGQPRRWTSGGFFSKVKGNDYTGIYINGDAVSTSGENGGTGKATITAGAYVARKSWTDNDGKYHAQNWLNVGEIANFSSHGPTIDGRLKPDIASPGQHIASAVNYRTYPPWMADVTPLKTQFRGQGQYWVLFSGTSMAAPHLTGAVALLLQADPDLTPQEIRDILRRTAKHDAFTGPDSNNTYGFGKLDAFEAMKRTITLHASKPGNNDELLKIYPNPADGKVWCAMRATFQEGLKIAVYTCTAKEVYVPAKAISNGLVELDCTALPSGVYLISCESKAGKKSGRICIKH